MGTLTDINDLKRQIFHDMLTLAGRVFILVRYSEDVMIGKRGFMPEEREKGIVLVFNRRMNFSWDESGISAKLVFGNNAENCVIPYDDILSIFSPELSAQFNVTQAQGPVPLPKEVKAAGPAKGRTRGAGNTRKVVEVDFTKKRT